MKSKNPWTRSIRAKEVVGIKREIGTTIEDSKAVILPRTESFYFGNKKYGKIKTLSEIVEMISLLLYKKDGNIVDTTYLFIHD